MSTSSPHLERMDDSSDRMAVALRWAHYLGEEFGTSGALNALRYYERLGWIGSRVVDRMTDYVRGLSLAETHTKKYDDPVTLEPPLASLSGTAFGAHARSLQFISEIAGEDIGEQVVLARLADRRVERAGGEDGDAPGRSAPFRIGAADRE
ncbi:MAG: FlaD/FlaE family flagellar protein [Haloarculaceae archaeon]